MVTLDINELKQIISEKFNCDIKEVKIKLETEKRKNGVIAGVQYYKDIAKFKCVEIKI